MFYFGIGGFVTGLVMLAALDFKNPLPLIIYTCFCGLFIVFGKRGS